jgi:hypothetical protein
MKSLYVDLDNNKLLAGSLNPLIASQQVFYSGNTETVTVDLIQRDSNFNLLNYVPSTGTTVSMVVGVPGNVVSIPAMTRSTQAGITGTATASLYSAITAIGTVSKYSAVTATVTASLYGNITAQATAVMTRGSACTLSVSVASVVYPILQARRIGGGNGASATVATTSVATPGYYALGISDGVGRDYVEIVSEGQNLWGSPIVMQTCATNGTFHQVAGGGSYYDIIYAYQNISSNFTFSNGKLVSVKPSVFTPVSGYGLIGITIIADPDYIYSANTVTVDNGGSGFPDGVDIPFSIPSDEDGDGRPCTGTMRAIGGAIVTASITNHGSRFTSSITDGKSYGILPAYKIQDITVTCAGAGYFGNSPTLTIDSTFYSNSAGTSQAQATTLTTVDGGISVILNSSGYGYTATPGISIQAPRLSDGVRSVTLTSAPTGYADGAYGCTVSGPATGTTAAVNMVVNNGAISFSILNQGTGYVTAPAIQCPAPNLANSIQRIAITSAGAGYTSAPTVTIYGAGSGASATATLAADGSIASVQVVSVGTGYTGTTTVGFSAPNNLGKIASISISTSGTNYTTAPAISFSGGGGSGAAATASVLNGGLYTIELTNEGSGYATAPAVTVAASPSRTIFTGLLTVTSAFVNAILPSTAVTVQISAASTIGTSTLLQVQGAVAGTI